MSIHTRTHHALEEDISVILLVTSLPSGYCALYRMIASSDIASWLYHRSQVREVNLIILLFQGYQVGYCALCTWFKKGASRNAIG
jgi:hypothetical protein